MIQGKEILEKARKYGVRITTIERDYSQNWILAHLKKINMALKGGTGIKKLFVEGYRFSDDLDFTLIEEYEKEELEEMLNTALSETHDKSGIRVDFPITLTPSDNGYYTRVRFYGVQTRSPIFLKLDLTINEMEDILLPTEERTIIHEYSDTLQESVKSYAKEEIVAEKIRALFQRSRARDLYDFWYLSKTVNKPLVKSILKRKFEKRETQFDIEMLRSNQTTFSSAWIVQLQHQLMLIPDFTEVFEEVIREIQDYEPS